MLKNFAHIDTESVDEAAGLLREGAGSSRIIAGGTDLLSVLKHKLEPDYPEPVSYTHLDVYKRQGGPGRDHCPENTGPVAGSVLPVLRASVFGRNGY